MKSLCRTANFVSLSACLWEMLNLLLGPAVPFLRVAQLNRVVFVPKQLLK